MILRYEGKLALTDYERSSDSIDDQRRTTKFGLCLEMLRQHGRVVHPAQVGSRP